MTWRDLNPSTQSHSIPLVTETIGALWPCQLLLVGMYTLISVSLMLTWTGNKSVSTLQRLYLFARLPVRNCSLCSKNDTEGGSRVCGKLTRHSAAPGELGELWQASRALFQWLICSEDTRRNRLAVVQVDLEVLKVKLSSTPLLLIIIIILKFSWFCFPLACPPPVLRASFVLYTHGMRIPPSLKRISI